MKFTKSFDSNQCICDSADNVLLENPDLISCFKDAHGPSLGALQTYQLTNTYFNNGFFIKVPKNLSDNLRIEIEHKSTQFLNKFHFTKILLPWKIILNLQLLKTYLTLRKILNPTVLYQTSLILK